MDSLWIRGKEAFVFGLEAFIFQLPKRRLHASEPISPVYPCIYIETYILICLYTHFPPSRLKVGPAHPNSMLENRLVVMSSRNVFRKWTKPLVILICLELLQPKRNLPPPSHSNGFRRPAASYPTGNWIDPAMVCPAAYRYTDCFER